MTTRTAALPSGRSLNLTMTDHQLLTELAYAAARSFDLESTPDQREDANEEWGALHAEALRRMHTRAEA